MTDEERQRLVALLREDGHTRRERLAADEIERLAEANEIYRVEIERLAEENKELKGKLDYASRLDEADD